MLGRIAAVFLFIGAVSFFFAFKSEDIPFLSPVSETRGVKDDLSKNFVKNEWFPKSGSDKGVSELAVLARGVILVDFDSGEVIYAQNSKDKLPAASTIKIMTALAAMENKSLDEIFRVSEKAASVGENSMGLTAGERLTLRELLYGLMLVSGNDAAVTIAENVSGSESGFAAIMNKRAQEIGMKDTVFINASGLDEDGKSQYTTAYDMAILAHYIWVNYPEFRKISETYNIFIEASENHKAFELYNDTNLLTTYPGVRGIKPGFTWEAGLCLVTYAEYNDKKLIGVILGSDDRRGQMKELLDFGFGQFGISVPHPALDG